MARMECSHNRSRSSDTAVRLITPVGDQEIKKSVDAVRVRRHRNCSSTKFCSGLSAGRQGIAVLKVRWHALWWGGCSGVQYPTEHLPCGCLVANVSGQVVAVWMPWGQAPVAI